MTVAFEAAVEQPPGEPQRLRDTAGLLGAAAHALDGVEADFRGTLTALDDTWFGLAGAAFRLRVRETIESIQVGAGSMRDGAAALMQLAAAIEEAQMTARTALDAAEAAVGEISSSRASLEALGNAGGSPAGARMVERLDRAKDDLLGARRMGEVARQAAAEAARRFAVAIDQATERAKAPPDPPERESIHGRTRSSSCTGRSATFWAINSIRAPRPTRSREGSTSAGRASGWSSDGLRASTRQRPARRCGTSQGIGSGAPPGPSGTGAPPRTVPASG
jgi:uncharacterized protein YukE